MAYIGHIKLTSKSTVRSYDNAPHKSYGHIKLTSKSTVKFLDNSPRRGYGHIKLTGASKVEVYDTSPRRSYGHIKLISISTVESYDNSPHKGYIKFTGASKYSGLDNNTTPDTFHDIGLISLTGTSTTKFYDNSPHIGRIKFKGISTVKTSNSPRYTGNIILRGISTVKTSGNPIYAGNIILRGASVVKTFGNPIHAGHIILRGISTVNTHDNPKHIGHFIVKGVSTYIIPASAFKISDTSDILLSGISQVKESILDDSVRYFTFDTNDPPVASQVELANEYVPLAQLFPKMINTDTFVHKEHIYVGDIIEPLHFNRFFDNIAVDLDFIETSLNKISADIEQSRLDFENKINDVDYGIRKADAILNEFALYAYAVSEEISGVTETFNKLTDIADSQNIFINTEEGIATLPIESKELIEIGNDFYVLTGNGAFTDNHDLINAFDDDKMSYAEYVASDVDDITLEIEIKLKREEIINNIVCEFLDENDAETTFIESFSISRDNISYTNVPINDNNSITFIPHIVNYMRLRFKKHTSSSEIISIRIANIAVYRISYKDTGSAIINKTIPPTKIDEVALHTKNAIVTDSAISANFSVSFDNNQFVDIQPVQANTTDEILYINFPEKKNNLSVVDNEFTKIAIKMVLSRNDDINDLAKLYTDELFVQTEIVTFPSKPPYAFTLKNRPKQNTLSIRGISNMILGTKQNSIPLGNVEASKYTYVFALPFDTKDMEEIYIKDYKLTKFSNFSDLMDYDLTGYYINPSANVLTINIQKHVIRTGDVGYGDPWIQNYSEKTAYADYKYEDNALAGSPISLYLKSDIIHAPQKNILPLTFYTDLIKDDITIQRLQLDSDNNILTEIVSDIVPAGQKNIKLSAIPVNLEEITLLNSDRVEYVDGVTEFQYATEFSYSVDISNGMLYLRDPFPEDVSISYRKELRSIISPNLYHIGPDGKSIILDPSIFSSSFAYMVNYRMAFDISADKYNLDIDGRTVTLKDKVIIADYIGLEDITDKMLIVSYESEYDMQNYIRSIMPYISPIIPEVSLLYSKEIS
jgi:hypothetical protein